MLGTNKITFTSTFSLSSFSISYILLQVLISRLSLDLGHFPPFSPFAVPVWECSLWSRFLWFSSPAFIIVPCFPSVCLDTGGIAGILLLYIKEQGAAGSAGPRGDWPGRARVRHHSRDGRLVSAWPKSKEDVCRASPCSPSLPTSLTLTHISRLSWTPTNSQDTAHLSPLVAHRRVA